MDYSPPQYLSDPENSDGSFDQDVSAEEYSQEYSRFNRNIGHDPVQAVGFGDSRYGVHPSNVTVARTGAAAGAPVAYRTDTETVYRFDGRNPDQIRADGGFRPQNNRLPVSLQSYQNTTQRSALVSFTRDPNPSAEMIDRTAALSQQNNPGRSDPQVYRYATSAPGGYDLTASLGTQSYPDQQEVAFYRGVQGGYIDSVTPYGVDAYGEPIQTGQTVPYTPASTSQYAYGPTYSTTTPNQTRTSSASTPAHSGHHHGHGGHGHGGRRSGGRSH